MVNGKVSVIVLVSIMTPTTICFNPLDTSTHSYIAITLTVNSNHIIITSNLFWLNNLQIVYDATTLVHVQVDDHVGASSLNGIIDEFRSLYLQWRMISLFKLFKLLLLLLLFDINMVQEDQVQIPFNSLLTYTHTQAIAQ